MAENIDKKTKTQKRGRGRGAGRTGDANDNFRLPLGKILFSIVIIAITAGIICISLGVNIGNSVGIGRGSKVKFTQLKDDKIPRKIESEIIPEYRELERALGCIADGKVYVIVTRGEKATAGYGLSIEDVRLEKEDKKTNLVVTALFTEPDTDEAVSEIITYPYAVAETELAALPDTIELVVRFED